MSGAIAQGCTGQTACPRRRSAAPPWRVATRTSRVPRVFFARRGLGFTRRPQVWTLDNDVLLARVAAIPCITWPPTASPVVALVYREKVLENLKIDISALSFIHSLCPNHGESRFWRETDGESRAVDIPRALADKLKVRFCFGSVGADPLLRVLADAFAHLVEKQPAPEGAPFYAAFEHNVDGGESFDTRPEESRARPNRGPHCKTLNKLLEVIGALELHQQNYLWREAQRAHELAELQA